VLEWFDGELLEDELEELLEEELDDESSDANCGYNLLLRFENSSS
jgi:hypothetical protein